MKRSILGLRAALVRLGFFLGRLMPLGRRVILATSHSDRIEGNLAAIREELARRAPDTPVVELAWRPAAGVRARLSVMRQALVAGYHLATARLFVVDDYFFPMYVIRPRPGTTRVQVWHACGAFKKFGFSVLDKSFGADEAMVRRVAIHSNYDLCLVSSMTAAPHYAEAFRQPLDRFVSRLGIPRTDFFADRAGLVRVAAAVRERYGIDEGRRVILYAPTFRGERVTQARYHDYLDLALLREILGDDYVTLVRLHPFIRDRLPMASELAGFAIDVSDAPDINDLLVASDVLVTDYSSVIYEYSLLGRPMLFLAPDLEAYEGERGFYFDYRSGVPGPIFATTRELADYIRGGRFDTTRVEAFSRASFDVVDGRASARFVDEIVLPAVAGRGVARTP